MHHDQSEWPGDGGGMLIMKRAAPPKTTAQSGFSMMEVLIAIVVIALGLLGLARLQTTMLGVEMESYQRSTALMVLEGMANAIRADEVGARNADYDSINCPDDEEDICDWIKRMAAPAAGEDIGGLIGVQGCVEVVPDTLKTLRISVAWQGLTPTAPPPEELDCGEGDYGDDEALRRVVSTVVVILDPNP